MQRDIVEVTMAVQPAQAAAADLGLDGQEVFAVQVTGGMEDGCAVLVGTEYAISDQDMIVYVAVDIAAEAVDKSHGAEAGTSRGIRTTLPDRGLHGAQEYLEQPADNFGLVA